MKPSVSALALTLAPSIMSVAAFAAESAATPAVASTEGLLKKYAFVACHQTVAKTVGPASKDVATKYRDKKDAELMLFDKVRKGGAGSWGQVAMPPNTTVPDEDLYVMIKWILAIK